MPRFVRWQRLLVDDQFRLVLRRHCILLGKSGYQGFRCHWMEKLINHNATFISFENVQTKHEVYLHASRQQEIKSKDEVQEESQWRKLQKLIMKRSKNGDHYEY
jgi:hypothetical protein